MKIYSLETTDFSNNGYGFLTDIIKAEVKEEINGEYILDMEYLLNGHLAEYLERENIIVCKVADGTEQPFRIKYIDRNFRTIKVKAYHISYDLGDDLVVDIAPTNLNAQAFGRWVLNNSTTHAATYTFNSDIATINSARYIRKNVLECFMGDEDNSMLNKFGGEFKRDGFTIDLKARIGEDTGVKLLVGKNINEITITIDDTSLYTRIVPVGYDGLTLPEIYVDSSLINNYPFPKGCVIKFEDIKYDETGEDPEAYHDIDDFYDALRDAAAQMFNEGLDKPLINVDIDWLDLSKTKEYENFTSLETIRLGDTLTCDMGNFQYTTRVISTIYDVLLDRITNFQIGKPLASYASQMNATIQEVENQDFSSLLEQAQENASNLLKNAMTGYIYFDYDNGNLYIMDNPNPDDAVKVWRWNLNGLGYSSTGINGTYGLAITMDGSIVADYITTGHLNTNVIEGYDSLVEQVESIINLIKDVEGTGSIQLEDAMEGELHRLEISGNISKLFPNDSSKYGYSLIISDDLVVSNDLYISSGVPYQNDIHYPSTTLYPRDSYLQVDNTLYYLDFDYLNYMSESVYDKLIIADNKQWIERNVGIDSNGDMYALDTPVIELKPDLAININTNSVITLLSFSEATLKASYMIENEYTENFATKAYVGSRITQTKNEIDLEVQQKVSDDEIIAKLNLAVEDGQGIINLVGNTVTIESDNFQLDETGHIDATAGDIGGFQLTENNFNNNINGLYDFSEYDLNIVKAYILQYLVSDDYALSLFDMDNSGTISAYDYSRMKAIINGTVENDKYLSGRFVINSDNPKNCVQMLDQNGNAVVSIGIGGINSNIMAAENMAISDLDDWESSSDAKGVYANKNGELLATSKVSSAAFINTSTEEKKKNITKLNKALDIIKQADIYEYNWKDEKKSSKKHYGLVIGEDYNTPDEFISNDKKGIDIYATLSICLQAIKEQQEQIDELKKENKSLKEEKNGKDKLSK